jgi:hypothetical protein
MKSENTTKYEIILKWVDQLPDDKEFLFSEAKQAKAFSMPTLQSTLPPLCKNGLMKRRIVNCKTIFYSKGKCWSFEKAMRANHKRLQVKAQYRKAQKAQQQGAKK